LRTGGGEALEAPPRRVAGRPEPAVEAGATVDRADDAVELHLLHAQVLLAPVAERADHLVERQQDVDVALASRSRDAIRVSTGVATRAGEVVAGVGSREPGVHEGGCPPPAACARVRPALA
jgi:hypothetical protein